MKSTDKNITEESTSTKLIEGDNDFTIKLDYICNNCKYKFICKYYNNISNAYKPLAKKNWSDNIKSEIKKLEVKCKYYKKEVKNEDKGLE